MKRRLSIFILVVLALLGMNLGALPVEAHNSAVVLYGWGTPTLDGIMSPGEWDNARHIDFTVNTPYGGTTPGTVYAMNDSTNLYLAVRFARTVVDPGNSVAFEFDNNNNGIQDEAEDAIVFTPGASPPFFDDVRFLNGTAPDDVSQGGTNDGAGAFHNNGTYSIYELSHPLDSADNANDFSLHPGDTVGFMASIRMIAGDYPAGFGDTDFPAASRGGWGDIIILPANLNATYTITIQAVAPVAPPSNPPIPPLQLNVPITWSKTGGTLPNAGTGTTLFNILQASGSVTLTAPLTTNNGTLQFFIFQQWLVGTPPSPPEITTSQRTVTFIPNANKLATARYQQISSLGSIYPLQSDVNPVGITHTVWVNIGLPVPGIKVMFKIDGANSASSGFAYTDATGKATCTYTGNNEGMDNIWAYIDSNNSGTYNVGEPRSANATGKSWVKNFVTGGGNIKDGKKVIWTFGGTVGVLPEGGAVGQFDIVNHITGISYHLDQFLVLTFYGQEAESPTASHNTARFRGVGTGSDGSNVTLVVIMEDADEPGQGKDRIAVVKLLPGPPPPGPSNTDPWIGTVYFPPSTLPPVLVDISGGNFQIHNIK